MKLLRVISSVNPAGGGPIEGIKQAQIPLHNLGVEVEIACCDSPDSPWLSDENLPKTFALGPARSGYCYTPALVNWLKDNVRNYDAVIVNGIWQYHSFATWRALSGSNIPYFVFAHGMLDPWFKHAYPLKHLKKWLYWPWAEYRVLRDARAVIFTCEEEKLLARNSFWLYRCNEEVVNYGTSAPALDREKQVTEFLRRFPELEGQRILLFLSRIHPKKACDNLIKAFAEVASLNPSVRLVMAGPDQVGWVSELKGLAAQLGVSDRIIWPGMLSGDVKWGAFQLAEVFVLPSHQENFGIAVAEALACGKPVLISNKINIWREVQADGAGIVEDDTVEGTRALLSQWFSKTDDGRADMGVATRQCFEKRFTIERSVQSLVNIIRRNL